MIEKIIIYLVAFFGLYLARILKKIDYDEIKDGAKYIIGFNILTAVGISVLLLSNSEFTFITPFLLLIGALIGHFFNHPYFYLGLSLFSSMLINETIFFINATLVLLFGITYLRKLQNEILFYILPLIFVLFNQSFVPYSEYISTLVSGMLISVAIFGKR